MKFYVYSEPIAVNGNLMPMLQNKSEACLSNQNKRNAVFVPNLKKAGNQRPLFQPLKLFTLQTFGKSRSRVKYLLILNKNFVAGF